MRDFIFNLTRLLTSDTGRWIITSLEMVSCFMLLFAGGRLTVRRSFWYYNIHSWGGVTGWGSVNIDWVWSGGDFLSFFLFSLLLLWWCMWLFLQPYFVLFCLWLVQINDSWGITSNLWILACNVSRLKWLNMVQVGESFWSHWLWQTIFIRLLKMLGYTIHISLWN